MQLSKPDFFNSPTFFKKAIQVVDEETLEKRKKALFIIISACLIIAPVFVYAITHI
ncbi:MAG: hypothetical protein LBV67_03055 [Streptococcaceae bacterium]|jgi:uncharacterized membrane protein YGL010W|nr:hypothetical protein [Streptococcaceae bacterium]